MPESLGFKTAPNESLPNNLSLPRSRPFGLPVCNPERADHETRRAPFSDASRVVSRDHTTRDPGQEAQSLCLSPALVLVEHAFDSISQLLECALLVEYEWTDRQALFAQLAAMRAGNLAHVIPFFNLLKLELWLRNAPHYSRQEHAFLGQRFAVLTGATGKRFSPTRLKSPSWGVLRTSSSRLDRRTGVRSIKALEHTTKHALPMRRMNRSEWNGVFDKRPPRFLVSFVARGHSHSAVMPTVVFATLSSAGIVPVLWGRDLPRP